MASKGQNDRGKKLAIFCISPGVIFVDFKYDYLESLTKASLKRKILLQAF